MMDGSGIYDKVNRKFSEDSVEFILNSAEKLFEPDKVVEIVLLNVQPFTSENFLETKDRIINENFEIREYDYTLTDDILFFYQVKVSTGKYYAIAHRDPFELYFNEAIIWYHQMAEKIGGYRNEQVIYSINNKNQR